jgi:hypothetical protein
MFLHEQATDMLGFVPATRRAIQEDNNMRIRHEFSFVKVCFAFMTIWAVTAIAQDAMAEQSRPTPTERLRAFEYQKQYSIEERLRQKRAQWHETDGIYRNHAERKEAEQRRASQQRIEAMRQRLKNQ